ncbi:radical SAM protein [Niveispirillum irakense]|uniref:radical SAM protein n=1 Tax=Niveispirillum irakense TaxID=34011 RepID=UPI001AEBF162|nr:radical SAM protein [Niveispirillum irakense]
MVSSTMRIHIINPANDAPSYHSAEIYAAVGAPGRTPVADLAIATIAAFVPQDWEISLSDEAILPVDLDRVGVGVDIVAITGKVSQRNRMIALAEAARRHGATVLIGGPYASLNPEQMRPHADILVCGEVEEIAHGLFTDIAAGQWRDRYEGTRPDLRTSPIPRWDLYPNHGATMGTLQTSRGCPFQCDFCDVIQYLGRKQRHKDVSQVIAELDVLYHHGYRQIFLADDNFTVYRQQARALLAALAEWQQARRSDPVYFMTQVSIDIARDSDLMRACVAAGLNTVFIGVETVNTDSLREAGKKQNLHQDIHAALATILGHGIAVHAGIVVGFDADQADIFDRLRGFIQDSPIPLLAIGSLVAPPGTPLYDRLRAEGRLDGPDWKNANGHTTNIIPRHMSRVELEQGVAQLCADVYAPRALEQRIDNFLAAYGGGVAPTAEPQPMGLPESEKPLLKWLSGQGMAEKAMIMRVLRKATFRPDAQGHILTFLSRYAQIRYMLKANEAGSEADSAAAA